MERPEQRRISHGVLLFSFTPTYTALKRYVSRVDFWCWRPFAYFLPPDFGTLVNVSLSLTRGIVILMGSGTVFLVSFFMGALASVPFLGAFAAYDEVDVALAGTF